MRPKKVKRFALRVLEEEHGATALEYALIAIFVALALALGAAVFSGSLENIYNRFGEIVKGLVTSVPDVD